VNLGNCTVNTVNVVLRLHAFSQRAKTDAAKAGNQAVNDLTRGHFKADD
jgi:hypothetical protein